MYPIGRDSYFQKPLKLIKNIIVAVKEHALTSVFTWNKDQNPNYWNFLPNGKLKGQKL